MVADGQVVAGPNPLTSGQRLHSATVCWPSSNSRKRNAHRCTVDRGSSFYKIKRQKTVSIGAQRNRDYFEIKNRKLLYPSLVRFGVSNIRWLYEMQQYEAEIYDKIEAENYANI